MKTFSNIAKVLKAVGNTSSTIDKQNILFANRDVEGLKDVLHFIFNPALKTNIKSAKLSKFSGTFKNEQVQYTEAIKYFKEHNTGTQADVEFAARFISSQELDAVPYAVALVTQTLKIGINVATLNKVFGRDFIQKIGVMLGTAYKDITTHSKSPKIITEKLDGHRLCLIKENGVVTMYSRNGLVQTGLTFVEQDAQYLPDNFMYDGECLAIGNFKNSIELRQATNSIMATKGTKIGITYNIFDMVPISDFKRGVSMENAFARKKRIANIFGDTSIQKLGCYNDTTLAISELMRPESVIHSVPILEYTDDEDTILEISKEIWDKGFEGTMALVYDSKYEVKRSKNLIKIKRVESHDLPIVGFVEGTGKNVGKLGSFIVEYKGNLVGVGSGLTDYERETYWKQQDELKGVLIEVDTLGESTNKNGGTSLNAPIFKGLRMDKS